MRSSGFLIASFAFMAQMFLSPHLLAGDATAAARELTPSEKACRIWFAKGVYVSGSTLQAIGRAVAERGEGGEECVARYLANGRDDPPFKNDNPCGTHCVAMGVEAELAGEPIRKYLEADLKQVVANEVKQELANFLKRLKDLNDAERKTLIDQLIRDLPDNPDLVDALKTKLETKDKE